MALSPMHVLEGVQAFVFDLMGTCTDWHSSILAAMRSHLIPPPLNDSDLPALAAAWRAGFFETIFVSFAAGDQAPDIDTVHAKVLDKLLNERGVTLDVWDEEVRERLVKAWHLQLPWPDSIEGIQKLKERYMVVVLANGTTRLQLDIVRSSRLPFDMLFSSQLLQATKPDPEIYSKALDLIGLHPEQAAMVAAHAYDLRAAAKLGMKTVYIHRPTEDPDEDMALIRNQVDIFIEGTKCSDGLLELARHVCS
ncbi:haloacid dehalogenase [Wolfiporia cocos MD-104 SS10]|uniref:Haloacid dehalogenase n=1 Tax=Wolfiporia cocos (strain MD-104) TaxID=742152 RepID=A0A2H3JCW7_WOLCO|nr:haloacid dehalogenase [Wolfiporia cocos MD-104 SS10]